MFTTMIGRKAALAVLLIILMSLNVSAGSYKDSLKRYWASSSWLPNEYFFSIERAIPVGEMGWLGIEIGTSVLDVYREPGQRLETGFWRVQSFMLKRYIPKFSKDINQGFYWGVSSFWFVTRKEDLTPYNHRLQVRLGPMIGLQLKIVKGLYWDAAYYQTLRLYTGNTAGTVLLPLVLGPFETRLTYRFNF